MNIVLDRLIEAANTHRPVANELSLIGKDESLMINRFGNPNKGWLLGFIVPSQDETEILVTSIKYMAQMGIPDSRHFSLDVGVYALMKCMQLDLVAKKTITPEVGGELLEFADYVIETNEHTKTGYELSRGDVVEYNYRNPRKPALVYIDKEQVPSEIEELFPLLTQLHRTKGVDWVHSHLTSMVDTSVFV